MFFFQALENLAHNGELWPLARLFRPNSGVIGWKSRIQQEEHSLDFCSIIANSSDITWLIQIQDIQGISVII